MGSIRGLFGILLYGNSQRLFLDAIPSLAPTTLQITATNQEITPLIQGIKLSWLSHLLKLSDVQNVHNKSEGEGGAEVPVKMFDCFMFNIV